MSGYPCYMCKILLSVILVIFYTKKQQYVTFASVLIGLFVLLYWILVQLLCNDVLCFHKIVMNLLAMITFVGHSKS
jgi:hypothetical protein